MKRNNVKKVAAVLLAVVMLVGCSIGATLAYLKMKTAPIVNTFTSSDITITLTETGRQIAEKIYERHTLLTELLVKMGVSQETAAADACRIEHAISDESFEAIRRFAENSAIFPKKACNFIFGCYNDVHYGKAFLPHTSEYL